VPAGRVESKEHPPTKSTASAVNNYSTHKQLPFRLISPLLDNYPAEFLLGLLYNYPKNIRNQ